MSLLTRCHLADCGDVGHVVLYASSDRLAGKDTTPRQPVVFCLKHGSQIYDVIRAWQTSEKRLSTGVVVQRTKHASCPAWLVTDLRNGRLPRTSIDPAGWPAASALALNKHRARK
jgi:hypothetical protein